MNETDYVVKIVLREGDREVCFKYDNLDGPPTLEIGGILFPKELHLFSRILTMLEDFRKGRYQ